MENATPATIANDPEKGFLTAAELRNRWRVSDMFLWRLRQKGKLTVYKLGRNVRFAVTEIQRIETDAADAVHREPAEAVAA